MIDLLRLLESHSIEYRIVSKDWVNVCCPFCGDTNYHLGIPLTGRVANCFRCGPHNFEYTIKSILGINNTLLDEILDKYRSRKIILEKEKKETATSVELPGDDLAPLHKEYLRKRGFDPNFLKEKYNLKGVGPIGDWKFRIIIPIYYNKEVVSYQGRAVKDGMVRYKTASNEESIIPAKSILYNLDNCSKESAVIVEGAFDVMRLGDGVIGTLGTGMTTAQIELLSTRFNKVIFFFDPEIEAQKRAEKFGSLLAGLGIDVDIFDSELEHDPGSLTEEEIALVKRELKLS